jgi:hypothetical protein
MAQTLVVNSAGMLPKVSVHKSPNDVIVVYVDFGLFFGSATASTLTVTGDTGITVGTTSVASNIATVPVSGGDSGYSYDVAVKLAGSSETKEIKFLVKVFDPEHYSPDDYGFVG